MSYDTDTFANEIDRSISFKPVLTQPAVSQNDGSDREATTPMIDVDVEGKDPVLSPVDAADDPEHPKNWPTWKKVFHTAIPSLYAFVATVGTSAFVPAIPFVMERFDVGREVAILGVSIYVLGVLIGPVFAAPLSELYGRRPVYWVTMPLLLVFTAVAASASNVAVLMIFRFLAGLGGSGALAVGAGSLADIWHPHSLARAGLFYILTPFLGPVLGPLIGAYIIGEYHEWRLALWVQMMIAAPVSIMALFISETSYSRIQYLHNKQQGVIASHQANVKGLLLRKLRTAITRPLHMMFVEPLVAYFSIYTAFAFAMIYSFFGSYNYVFQTVYNFNQESIGLTFLGILVGFFFAVISFVIFDALIYRKAVVKTGGKPTPEHRLYAALLGSFMLPVGLFWFAWSPRKDVHWIVPVLSGIPFGWGCVAIFLSSMTYLVDVYGSAVGASAIAANGILRYGFGAAFPLFTIQMYDAMGIHWAGSVFGFVSLLMMPVPWIFYFKGKTLRARSHYDTCSY